VSSIRQENQEGTQGFIETGKVGPNGLQPKVMGEYEAKPSALG
jgi:hypothetical protein